MAADYAHTFGRVTISGVCLGGAEQWSTGFQLGFEGADLTEVVPGAAERIAVHWEVFFEAAGHAISNNYQTREVKLAKINTNGTTDTASIDYWTYPAPIFGPRGGAIFPVQVTLAATMTTQNQRGLASKGRMYLPGVNEPISQTTGKLESAFQTTLVNGFKTFLDSINADDDIPGLVIVASKGHKTNQLDTNGQPVYLNGVNADVTGCRIGNVYDTQRRRRNDLTEQYTTAVLA